MPRDSGGVYSLPSGYVATPNTTILVSQHNPTFEDVAQALTDSLPRSGAAGMTGPLLLNADPTLALHAATKQYVDNQIDDETKAFNGGTSTGSANAQILAATDPDTFALTIGNRILFNPGFANTGPATLQITAPAIAATNIFKVSPSGVIALQGGELVPGQLAEIVYDGTRYLLLNNATVETGPLTDLVAAATTDIGTIGSRNVRITAGAGPITSFGSAAKAAFPLFYLTWATSVQVTHNGTSLILPGAANITPAVGDVWVVMALGSGNFRVISISLGAIAITGTSVPKRHTVLSGPIDSSGLPNFWPATSVNLTLTMQNVTSTSLVVAFAKGFGVIGAIDSVGQISTNLAVVLPASNTSYIYVDDTGTLGSTTLQPIYQYGGTISVANGQHTFDILQMKMFVGNGSAATAVNRVFLGEAVTSGSAVTSTVCYAYQGLYKSTGVVPATSTRASFSHNIGTTEVEVAVGLRCDTTNGGYAVGNVVWGFAASPGGGSYLPNPFSNDDRNTMGVICAANAFRIANKTTGADVLITLASWSYVVTANRRF